MSSSMGLLTYIGLGVVGGALGAKLKIPAGALIGAMLTIIVFKLEKQDLVRRRRPADNQRSVEVQITESGKQTYEFLDKASSQMISDLLDNIPGERQVAIVEAMEEVAELLNPGNEVFQKLLIRMPVRHIR